MFFVLYSSNVTMVDTKLFNYQFAYYYAYLRQESRIKYLLKIIRLRGIVRGAIRKVVSHQYHYETCTGCA